MKNVRDKGNPIEILEKPHNLRTIPGTPKILEKTSQSADHPRDPENPGKKPHNITHLLVVVVGCWLVVVGSDKLCRGPLRGQLLYVLPKENVKFHKFPKKRIDENMIFHEFLGGC